MESISRLSYWLIWYRKPLKRKGWAGKNILGYHAYEIKFRGRGHSKNQIRWEGAQEISADPPVYIFYRIVLTLEISFTSKNIPCS